MRKVLFIFGQLTDEDVDWIARVGELEKLDAGMTIVHRGRNIENIYIILEGSFSVFHTADLSKSTATVHSGEVVGEMSFIDARPPSATVRSDGSALVLKISKPELQSKLDTDKGFAARFYRSTSILLSDRVRSLNRRLAQAQGGSAAEFEDAHLEDELDPNVLEGVSFAGNRFDRMLKHLKKQE
jgi:CRP-like cAMP-binding protein